MKCSACAEREVFSEREAHSVREVSLPDNQRNTLLLIAAEPQYFTVPCGTASLAPQGAYFTLQSITLLIERRACLSATGPFSCTFSLECASFRCYTLISPC